MPFYSGVLKRFFATAQNDYNNNSFIKIVCNNCIDTDFSLFTKPSRGISEAKVEHQSTETLSFRCWSERCRLMRGAVNNQAFTLAEGATHVAHWNNSCKIAFTLAEVLITLGIIGVVAAMTLPSLIQNYQEKVRVSQLKKAYATISNAYISVLNEEGDMSEWADVETWDDVTDKFAKYINKVKVCKDAQGGCFAPIVRKDLTGNEVQNIDNYSAIISSDGTVIAFNAQVPLEEAKSCSNLNYCFNITVDINGDKLPNQFGIDTFIFHVGKEKILPRGASTTHGRETLCNPKGNSTNAAGWYNGSGCGAWVIYNENMDYLKCVKGSQKYCNRNYYF